MDEAGTAWLQPDELDSAEHRAQYATDEVEVHALARQTLLRLIEEVRWYRQQAVMTDGLPSPPAPRERWTRDARSERPTMPWRTSA